MTSINSILFFGQRKIYFSAIITRSFIAPFLIGVFNFSINKIPYNENDRMDDSVTIWTIKWCKNILIININFMNNDESKYFINRSYQFFVN